MCKLKEKEAQNDDTSRASNSQSQACSTPALYTLLRSAQRPCVFYSSLHLTYVLRPPRYAAFIRLFVQYSLQIDLNSYHRPSTYRRCVISTHAPRIHHCIITSLTGYVKPDSSCHFAYHGLLSRSARFLRYRPPRTTRLKNTSGTCTNPATSDATILSIPVTRTSIPNGTAFLVEIKPLGVLDEWLRMHPKMATLLRVRSGDRRDTHPRWQRNRECGRIPLRPHHPRHTMTSSGPEAYVTFGPILDSVIPGPPCRTHRNSAIAPIHSLVLWRTYLITPKHGALSKKTEHPNTFFLSSFSARLQLLTPPNIR